MPITKTQITDRTWLMYKRTQVSQYGFEEVQTDQRTWAACSPDFDRVTSRDVNWKTKIALLQDASAPYYKQKISLKGASGFFNGMNNVTARPCWAAMNYSGLTSPVTIGLANGEDEALRNMAVIRLKRKLSEQEAQWKALPFIGEIREMTDLVHQTNALLQKTVHLLLNLKKNARRDVAKYAADLWLTQSFAVNPLLSDIESAAIALARYNTGTVSTPGRVVGSASKRFQLPISEHLGMGNGFYLNSRGTLNVELRYTYTAGFNVKIRNANSYMAENQFGFSMGELPSTLWELTAFSWVSDYFFTMGDFLSDLFFDDGGATTYCTEFKKVNAVGSMTLNHELPPFVSGFTRWSSKTADVKFSSGRRVPIGSLPRVRLYYKTFDGVGVNGLNRLFNLASLLVK